MSRDLYHISAIELDIDKLIHPRIPKNHYTERGYEDNKIKRISVSDTLDGAVSAVPLKGEHDFHVYRVKSDKYKTVETRALVNKKLVPDAQYTNEIWITTPVKFEKIGLIKPKIPKRKGLGYDRPIIYTYGRDEKGKKLTGEIWYWDIEILEWKHKNEPVRKMVK